MKLILLILEICLAAVIFSCKESLVKTNTSWLYDGSKEVLSNDTILFERGKRYFLSLDMTDKFYENIYIGAYGDTLLSKPILDGSIFHFDFDSAGWKDYEVIKGVKFYKKLTGGLDIVENVYADNDMLTLAREPDADEDIVTGQKNSFKGFFKIDSVDAASPKQKFYDHNNIKDWGKDAEVVSRTQNWSYEVRRMIRTNSGLETADPFQDPLRKDWGYFIQRSYEALDSTGEWYYDQENKILYFSPLMPKCTIYISGGKNENNAGIELKGGKNITIEGMRFVNFKFGISAEGVENLVIKNCDIENCIYGIFNKDDNLKNGRIEGNNIRNMRSFGIKLSGDSTIIKKNFIENIGMTLGAESRGYNNLCGIDLRGKDNVISDNTITNTGYAGIRFFGSGGCRVSGNRIENAVMLLSDGGGIYTWRYIEGDRNKLIRGNTVLKVYGNADGTTSRYDHSAGIYLDEMSLNFLVDSNYVAGSGGGIYLQNSRSDTVMFNKTEKNKAYEFQISHGGTILNGGKLNPDNDPDFDPDKLDPIPNDYVWDREKGLLYYKNKAKGVVYVKPGNNLVKDNEFIPSQAKNEYTVHFKTWQNLTDDLIFKLTGNDDFFYNNIPDSLVKDASLFLQGSNVRDGYSGKDFDVVKNNIDRSKFGFLRKLYIWIGRGTKNPVEK
jgi:parallel beta-helix repeat protein